MKDICPICQCRIGDWSNAIGKTAIVKGQVCHTFCLQDFKLKHGKEYGSEEAKKMAQPTPPRP